MFFRYKPGVIGPLDVVYQIGVPSIDLDFSVESRISPHIMMTYPEQSCRLRSTSQSVCSSGDVRLKAFFSVVRRLAMFVALPRFCFRASWTKLSVSMSEPR